MRSLLACAVLVGLRAGPRDVEVRIVADLGLLEEIRYGPVAAKPQEDVT